MICSLAFLNERPKHICAERLRAHEADMDVLTSL